ncbi:hypothetical protein LOTGIDRAFT_180494 [Lottia gigantea]|uniref:Uncharacterized protein n=1 Tax=Lottia gigantea TaxID=225164 RepID=V4APK1_LOTGI|nr:hypothetical protein LOTGIDRAFT_180494 [Lottia gigantea]ESO99132.1 hypothetical protein LOTGIDRAFT_180494 [Lottia gigantea]
MFDLQVQITELHKECAKLQKELDNTNAKLCSSMNSIKTFWSPELKKERTIRKDETARYVLLNEQYRVAQAELQVGHFIIFIILKAIIELLKKVESSKSNDVDALPALHISSQDLDTIGQDKSDQESKEILILRKTVDEMELRIETQKQTLAARDESIKKLLEMLQSKGLSVKNFDEDRQEVESLRSKMVEESLRVKQLENLLQEKDKEILKLKESPQNASDSGVSLASNDNTHTMQAIIEAKLEKVRNKLSVKETELEGLRLKVETSQRQQAEKEQYVTVLKEQISAKELHSSMLQADVR